MQTRTVLPVLGAALCALAPSFLAAQSAAPTFTHKVELDRLGIESQDSTGTCWSFATVSFLESELARMHSKQIDLSEMYPVYFAYLEKADRYIKAKGKAQFGQGGLCHDVFHVIDRYGLAPATAFDGLCDDDKRHNHGEMEAALKGMATALAESRRGPRGDRWQAAYRGILDAYLGEVPSTIEVEGKSVTPLEYAHDVLGLRGEDYLTMMSFESQPFWKRATLEVPDNWMRYDQYLNVPIETAMQSIDTALERGFTIAVDMDVSERGFQAQRGVARLPDDQESEDFVVTDSWRQDAFAKGETTDDHLMHIVGVAQDSEGQPYYLTKNSWGSVGPYKGYLYMSRKFVAAKLLAFSAHKDAFDAEVLDKIK